MTRRHRLRAACIAATLVLASIGSVRALDPPHDASEGIDCSNCHLTHHAPGGAITLVDGNPNLCMSCHTAGGRASEVPFADADQAEPGIGGTSHRWDSGAAGRLEAEPANSSPGKILSRGAFTGRYSKTYTISIATAGDAGTARFDWSSSLPVADTYRDELGSLSYSGSNGSLDWSAAPWTEVNEADGVAAGSVRVVTSTQCSAGSCLRIGGGSIAAIGVRRAAALTGASSAMLSISYRRQLATCPNTSTANVTVQVSRDGAAWTTLATHNLNACDAASVSESFDITAQITPTTQIRLLGSGTAGPNDFLYVDNVQVEQLAAGDGASGVLSGTSIGLDEGVSVDFVNATPAPSFRTGDRWTLYVTREVNPPTLPALTARLSSGKVTCSTCHNEHSQMAAPFDANAPPYPAVGPGGDGRHNQRIDNSTNQMCANCHQAHAVGDAALGSHPVGVPIPAGHYKAPGTLPLDTAGDAVQCMSCHAAHGADSGDGMLTRVADTNALCTDCHTLADTSTPAAHLGDGGALWPGPQYGSRFPAVSDAAQRGFCTNCHQPHGWPDAASPATDFPRLLVGSEENLCFACHDGHPSSTNVLVQFTKSYRHPTTDYTGRHSGTEGGNASAFGAANRHAECDDCHDPHRARADATAPVAPNASNTIRAVGRVSVANGAAGTVPTYTYRSADDATPALEYEVCFKCHSSWTTQPAGQTDFAVRFNRNNPSTHPVEGPGKNLNINGNSFVNGWTATKLTYCTDCHTSEDTTVRGPHGSQNRYLLKRPYVASSALRTTASTESCFDCHSFNTYANQNASPTVQSYSRFNRPNFEAGHAFHVNERRYPCYSCHDSHGSATRPHLIVTGRNPGLNAYTETATGGSCSPTCHKTYSYTLNYPR